MRVPERRRGTKSTECWDWSLAGSSLERSVHSLCPVRHRHPCLVTLGDRREAYLPAEHPSSFPEAWLPGQDEHPRWSRGPEVPPRQGPGSSVRLIATIHERDSFLRLRREGTRHRIEPLWCSFVHDPQLTPPQVAFAIGRPVGSAVKRNRVRRRLRAILADSSVPPGLLLIGAGPAIVELTFDELEDRVRRLLERLTTTPT
jgi:ribonuclease P protein component